MRDTSSTAAEQPVTDQQVADYIRQHPSFFERHPDLLVELSLPHDSGNAISLVERQVSVLRERNIDTRQRLVSLIENARGNDKLFEKSKRLILALLDAQTVQDICGNLLYSFDKDFSIQYSSLCLIHEPVIDLDDRVLFCSKEQARQTLGNMIKQPQPTCGVLPEETIDFLFPEYSRAIQSAAIAPLVCGTTFGFLAVANRDPHCYSADSGTVFLSYIAEVLSRLLPQHLK